MVSPYDVVCSMRGVLLCDVIAADNTNYSVNKFEAIRMQ